MMRPVIQTVLNDMLNSVREMILKIIILSLKPYIYYTEAFYFLSELYYPSLYIHTLIYSHLLIHFSLSSFLLLSISDDVCSFRTFSFYSESESLIELYSTEEFT